MTNESSLFECMPNEEKKQSGDKFQVYEEVKERKLGEQIAENIFLKTTIDENKTPEGRHEIMRDAYSITGKEDLIQFGISLDRETHELEIEGKGKVESGNCERFFEPVRRNRADDYLPWQITSMLVDLFDSKKIENFPSDKLIAIIKELKPIYDEGKRQDEEALKNAGGREGWIKKIKERDRETQTHSDWFINYSWELYGPQNWRKVISAAEEKLGGKMGYTDIYSTQKKTYWSRNWVTDKDTVSKPEYPAHFEGRF